jgi:hypothetical protein
MAPDDDTSTSAVSIIPVTDKQAVAITGLSEFGKTVVTEAGQLARYMGRVLGTVPEDAVGLVIGDPLHFVRTAIAKTYDVLLNKLFKDRGVKETQAVSPSLAIPLLRAAYDESRPELQQLWAALIAAAMDPTRSGRVRISFIDVVKQLDPLDALVLRARYMTPGALEPDAARYIASTLSVSGDDTYLSFENLRRLGCVDTNRGLADFFVTAYGKALIRACEP